MKANMVSDVEVAQFREVIEAVNHAATSTDPDTWLPSREEVVERRCALEAAEANALMRTLRDPSLVCALYVCPGKRINPHSRQYDVVVGFVSVETEASEANGNIRTLKLTPAWGDRVYPMIGMTYGWPQGFPAQPEDTEWVVMACLSLQPRRAISSYKHRPEEAQAFTPPLGVIRFRADTWIAKDYKSDS